MSEEIVEKILGLIKEKTKACTKPVIEKLAATGVEITPEREEIINEAFGKMMFAAWAASALLQQHPDMTADDLDKMLAGVEEKDPEEGELKWKTIKR